MQNVSLLSKVQGIVWSVVWTTRHISDREQIVFDLPIFIEIQCILIYTSPITFDTLIFFISVVCERESSLTLLKERYEQPYHIMILTCQR